MSIGSMVTLKSNYKISLLAPTSFSPQKINTLYHMAVSSRVFLQYGLPLETITKTGRGPSNLKLVKILFDHTKIVLCLTTLIKSV